MTVNEAYELLQLIVRTGNQRAAAAELGCSAWVISNRMGKARTLLGDTAVLAYMNSCIPAGSPVKPRQRLDNKKSLNCHICGAEKKQSPSTGNLVCRPCANLNNRAYKDRVPAQVKAAGREYYATNREIIREKQREYRAANRDEIIARRAAYRAANPGMDAAYYRANAERIKASTRAYRAANADKVAAYFRLIDQTPARREQNRARLSAWKKAHPDRVNADTARRQLILRQAYVSWANNELITEFYALAQLRTQLTGIAWQVDHIVPLNSEFVCGLHCEANLQVIPAVTNLAKSNDWWPDMFSAPAPSLAAFFELPSLYLVAPSRACLSAPSTASANEPLMEAA